MRRRPRNSFVLKTKLLSEGQGTARDDRRHVVELDHGFVFSELELQRMTDRREHTCSVGTDNQMAPQRQRVTRPPIHTSLALATINRYEEPVRRNAERNVLAVPGVQDNAGAVERCRLDLCLKGLLVPLVPTPQPSIGSRSQRVPIS